MERKEVQKAATQQILKHKRCAIQISPRVGKTRTILQTFKNIPRDILISVPEEGIFKSWLDECELIGFPKKRLKLICHSSLHKAEKENIVIIDEAHASCTTKRLTALNNFKDSEYLVLMSGSFTKLHLETIKFALNLDLVYNYSFEKAIEDGIISNYEIVVYKVKLLPEEEVEYRKLTSKVEWAKTYGSRLQLKFIALARGRFLYNLKSKNIIVKKLIQKKERVLVFNNLINAAESTCEFTHSSKNMAGNLDKFKHKEINRLGVVALGNMGITFPELNNVIFNSVQASQVKFIQRALRACNLEEDVNKIAKIEVVISKGTQEEQWLKSALEMFSSSKVKYIEEYEI